MKKKRKLEKVKDDNGSDQDKGEEKEEMVDDGKKMREEGVIKQVKSKERE